MRIRFLTALTGLFPAWWRRRYRDEFVEMVRSLVAHRRRDTVALALDIVVGAVDAHLFGHAMGRPPGRFATWFPPPRRRAMAVTAGCGLAVSLAATLVLRSPEQGLALPIALLGGLWTVYGTWLAAHPVRPRADTVVLLAGVAGVVTTVIVASVRYPGAVIDHTYGLPILFALILLAYSVFALTPPSRLAADRAGVRWGVLIGLACGVVWTVLAVTRPATGDGVQSALWPVAALELLGAFGVGVLRHDRRAGVRTGIWAGLVASLSFFLVNLIDMLSRHSLPLTYAYDIARFPHSGFATTAAYLLNDEIGGLTVGLFILPLYMTAFGILGNGAGVFLRRRFRVRA